MTELARYEDTGAVASAFSRRTLTREHHQILKQQVAPTLTIPEFEVFLAFCEARALNPWTGQVVPIKRKMKDGSEKVAYQTSVNGLYSIAARTGLWEGQTEPEWCGKDGVWSTVWLTPAVSPVAARIGVFRRGFRQPLVAVAHMSSFRQSSPTWGSMPELMLCKCAKAMALREAFPEELGAIYADEEMGQLDATTVRVTPKSQGNQKQTRQDKKTAPNSKPAGGGEAYLRLTALSKEKFAGRLDPKAAFDEWCQVQGTTRKEAYFADDATLQRLYEELTRYQEPAPVAAAESVADQADVVEGEVVSHG